MEDRFSGSDSKQYAIPVSLDCPDRLWQCCYWFPVLDHLASLTGTICRVPVS